MKGPAGGELREHVDRRSHLAPAGMYADANTESTPGSGQSQSRRAQGVRPLRLLEGQLDRQPHGRPGA